MSIENIIHRIASDPEFGSAIAEDPVATLEAHGLELHPEELAALQAAMSTPNGSSLIMDAPDGPTEWFAPQFKGVIAGPTEWFKAQFRTEIA